MFALFFEVMRENWVRLCLISAIYFIHHQIFALDLFPILLENTNPFRACLWISTSVLRLEDC